MGNWEEFKKAEKKLQEAKFNVDKYRQEHNRLILEQEMAEESLQNIREELANLENGELSIEQLEKEYEEIRALYEEKEKALIEETLNE